MLAELDGAVGRDDLLEPGAPFDERLEAQVLAIEVKQVEGDEDHPLRLQPHRRAQQADVRDALVVEHHDFAVDDGRFHVKRGSRLDDRPIPVAPVEAAPREGAGRAVRDEKLGAIAVPFDLVDPVVTLRRLADQRGQLELDETQRSHPYAAVRIGAIFSMSRATALPATARS